MALGSSDWRDWVLEAEESKEIIERAVDVGINFFDTANLYSFGESERVLGEALEGYKEESVVATKAYFRMDQENRNSGGLSRKGIEQELDASLERLGMDTIDLYQIHCWDHRTPIEETLRALDDAVRRGKIRYIGGAGLRAYQLAKAIYTSRLLNLNEFVSIQNHYNLVYREEEREMLPFCRGEGIGTVPLSPLARGYLSRPHDQVEATLRGKTDDIIYEAPYMEYCGEEINNRVRNLAREKGVSMAQIGLAWLLHKDDVDAPAVGVTKVEHVDQAVEALSIRLTNSDIEYLEEPYRPVDSFGVDYGKVSRVPVDQREDVGDL